MHDKATQPIMLEWIVQKLFHGCHSSMNYWDTHHLWEHNLSRSFWRMLAFSINAFFFFLLVLKTSIHLSERTAKSRFIGTSRKGIYPPDILGLFLILFLLVSYVLPINNAKMLTKVEKAEKNIHYHANEISWSTR